VRSGAKKIGWIDRTGAFVIPPLELERSGPFSDGVAIVGLGLRLGFIDRKGALKWMDGADGLDEFSEGLAAIYWDRSRGCGYIDKAGRTAIAAGFAVCGIFSEGLAAAGSEGKVGFIDRTGKFVVQPRYRSVESFFEGLAKVEGDNGVGFIDRTGKPAFPATFADAMNYSDGLAAVQSGELWGFIDKQGTMRISPRFERGNIRMYFRGGMAPAQEPGGKVGYIGPDGRWVIRPQFEYGYAPTAEGVANVRLADSNRWTYIDRTGRVLWK